MCSWLLCLWTGPQSSWEGAGVAFVALCWGRGGCWRTAQPIASSSGSTALLCPQPLLRMEVEQLGTAKKHWLKSLQGSLPCSCCCGSGEAAWCWHQHSCVGRSNPSGAITLTFLLMEAMDLMGKARKGSAAAVLLPYLSCPCAAGTQRTMLEDTKGIDLMLMAEVSPIPAAGGCELSAPRCTHLCYGIQHPLQPHLLLLPSQQEQMERDRLQKQNCSWSL